MSDVEFETDISSGSSRGGQPVQYAYTAPAEENGLTGWLIRHKLAKDSRTAIGIFIAIIVVNIAIVCWVWRNPHPNPRPQTSSEVVTPSLYRSQYMPLNVR
jgi:hypothetical protein